MTTYLLSIFCSAFMFFGGTTFAQQVDDEQRAAQRDSLLETYSIEEILGIKDYYERQLLKLENEKETLRKQGLKEAEEFLKKNPDSRILDKVIIRLAELYFQDDNEIFLTKMQQYDQLVEELEKTGSLDTSLAEPQKNYDRSLALYQKIIDEFPQSNLFDDAIYNKAFLLEELGRIEDALAIYDQLVIDFPSSRYVPEALMRIAEYYFNPPLNDIEKAIEIYKQILEFKDSPKFDEALYRLGWSYYRLNNYPEAVAYFTLLADDIEQARKLDPNQKYSNPALRDESIEYIGISFLDYGGSERAAEYIKSIGGRVYGVEILKKIGDIYKDEKEEYNKAIDTYSLLLRMYPESILAPEIQSKIVECYRYVNDDMMAYLGRDKLYNQYKPGSPWWQKNEDEDLREKSYKLTESAMRDNINLLYQKAETTGDMDLYLQAVNDSRKYLKSFPADTNAPLIHWNMAWTLDIKLKNYEQAFDEYMKICDLYWNSRFQKNAAENAIALARDAVATDTTKKKMELPQKSVAELQQSASLISAITYNKIELTDAEQKLARAYDNYIKLFPHEPQTAMILANAGALYYNNNQFARALKYYNTIVKHFPDSKDVNYAKYTIMESYFGKHDFKSAEIVARRLKNTPSTDPELLAKAKARLAESIFLAAQVYADSADHLTAGNEYIRVVLEVPDAEFADLSLFKAACEYDEAKEYSRAVETYNYLIDTKPNSKYKLNAMNNLAINYGELGDYKNAAITYEKLAYATVDDSAKSYNSLFNASIFFVKAQEWKDAIRINRTFVNKYPRSEDADDLFFDIATYYIKLEDIDSANKIYGEYVQNYPQSPRVVEIFFNRGEYYRHRNENYLAIAEYQKAIEKNEEFKKSNIKTNDFFAAEALFNLTRLKYDEYVQIQFLLPYSKMEDAKKNKRNILKEVIDGFTGVVSYGTLRLYEATYYIGDTYEEFAETWVRQEIPPMEEMRRVVLQNEINQTSAELYERAEKSYKQAVKVLTRLAEQYEQDLIQADTTQLISEAQLKKVKDDSTLRVARKWIERCKEKVSEVIYDRAELNSTSVKLFLNAPIPSGLDNVAEMEYRKQVLSKAVAPLIIQIIDDHTRNIREAWQMGLENQWVKLSRNKVVTTNNILSTEYHKLALRALLLYETTSQTYKRLVEKGGLTADGFDAMALSEQMANLLDFGKTFAAISFDLKKKIIEKAIAENISDPIISVTKENMLKNLFEYTQQCDSLLFITNLTRKQYENQYKETDKPEHEEALFTYEDNYFYLREMMVELLKIGFEVSAELNLKNDWSTKILLSLVKLEPEQYSNLLGLTIDATDIATDVSWKAITTYESGWTNIDYDDSRWSTAVMVTPDEFSHSNKPAKIWLMIKDTLAIVPDRKENDDPITSQLDTATSDSMMTQQALSDSVARNKIFISSKPQIKSLPSSHVYFRKSFYIEGLPVAAEIRLKMDDSYNLFLNGEYMSNFVADSTEWRLERTHDLTDFLRPQKNVIAIEGKDTNQTGEGFEAVLKIKNIANWDRQRQIYQIETSDEKVKQNLIMDKYILF